ncbi:MAG: FAD-binding protein [Candidatus Nitricoxidivorans perseverans]|uniref:Electron transfer flavoprotein subunit alpha n=1 Tax=Candidatus Nitricoxidivorans perseverans TaxID=2975601 RepID=A0AA49FLC5_9PROT|nr:MAG: FAD-binding protein [Candidatus Nitricoxidivorans perseverans]
MTMVLIIAEHDNARLSPAMPGVVAAAAKIGGELHVLVAGHGCGGVAHAAARIAGVAKVSLADAAHYADQGAENLAALIVAHVGNQVGNCGHILLPATTFGKNLGPRIAALLDVAQVSDIVAVESVDTFVRPIHAGNVLVTVRSADAVKVVTVRATAFEAPASDGAIAAIENLPPGPDLGLSKLVGRELTRSARPELAGAKAVVAGGRGLASAENYRNLLEPLADRLGAALGATRAAVDAGFAPNDFQVGQTGKVVAPRLYVAVGISGAIQHLAGMKDSRVIVAINKDPEAPIFQVADIGLVADLFQAVPELTAALESCIIPDGRS